MIMKLLGFLLTFISCSDSMSHVFVKAIFVVETLLSLSGMLLAMRCATGAAALVEEFPLPLLRLCLSSDGEMGPEELST